LLNSCSGQNARKRKIASDEDFLFSFLASADGAIQRKRDKETKTAMKTVVVLPRSRIPFHIILSFHIVWVDGLKTSLNKHTTSFLDWTLNLKLPV